MNIEILYEDADLLVINKPAGLVVNEAASQRGQTTIQSWFWQRLNDASEVESQVEEDLLPENFDQRFGTPLEIFAERKGMVHRLDKETSGTLVLAKNPTSLVNLLAQFKNRQTTKKYLSLVHGRFGIEADIISFPIARSTQERTKFRVDIMGREALTFYQVKATYLGLNLNALSERGVTEANLKLLKKHKDSYQGFSLVECWPKTGRTHQLRVHLAHIKHPLVGDKLYVGKKRRKLDVIWCERHFLHASELSFAHPRTKQILTVVAPLPKELEQTLALLIH